jgi:hypothetical protein
MTCLQAGLEEDHRCPEVLSSSLHVPLKEDESDRHCVGLEVLELEQLSSTPSDQHSQGVYPVCPGAFLVLVLCHKLKSVGRSWGRLVPQL